MLGIDDINRLQEENEKLKEYKKSKQASYEEMQRKLNLTKWENRSLRIENDKLKHLLVKINDIAVVNAITTCWTIMDQCDKCSDKQNCKIQSPITKLEVIRQNINGALGNVESK